MLSMGDLSRSYTGFGLPVEYTVERPHCRSLSVPERLAYEAYHAVPDLRHHLKRMWHPSAARFETQVLKLFRVIGNEAATLQSY